MPTIRRLSPIESIKPGPGSTVLPNGTIVNPVPYSAVDIEFDDGVTVQVERPLTLAKLQAARATATTAAPAIDGFRPGNTIP